MNFWFSGLFLVEYSFFSLHWWNRGGRTGSQLQEILLSVVRTIPMQEKRPWGGQTAVNLRDIFLINSVDGLSHFELAVPSWEQGIYFWVCKRGRDCTRLLQIQKLKLYFSQLAMPGIFCSGPSIAIWISIWTAASIYIPTWVRTGGLLYLHEEVAWQKAVALACCRGGRIQRHLLRLKAGEVWRLKTPQGVWRSTCRGLVCPTFVDMT